MGNQWRFLSETVKQKWGLAVEKNFRPTSNARNEAMFAEATKFANHLKQFEKDLKTWQKNAEASFMTMQGTLAAPLPMAAESEPTAQAHIQALQVASQELSKRLDTEVLKPIQQWMVAYKMIQEHMKKSEELRLILDSRRRTVLQLQGKEERYRSLLTGTHRERGESSLKLTTHQKIHKEDKMNRDLEQFRQKEQTVYNSLFTLIKDTSVLRDYAACAVQIMQESFAKASQTFEAGAGSIYAGATGYGTHPSQVLMADPNYLNVGSKPGSTHSKMDPYPAHADVNPYEPKPSTPTYSHHSGPYAGHTGQQHSHSAMLAHPHAQAAMADTHHHDRYPSPRY